MYNPIRFSWENSRFANFAHNLFLLRRNVKSPFLDRMLCSCTFYQVHSRFWSSRSSSRSNFKCEINLSLAVGSSVSHISFPKSPDLLWTSFLGVWIFAIGAKFVGHTYSFYATWFCKAAYHTQCDKGLNHVAKFRYACPSRDKMMLRHFCLGTFLRLWQGSGIEKCPVLPTPVSDFLSCLPFGTAKWSA